MKPLHSAAVIFVLTAASASAQLEGVAEMKFQAFGHGGTTMSGTGKTYVTKTAWRTEMEMSSADMAKDLAASKAHGGQTSMRMVAFGKLAEPGVSYMLNDRTKSFARIDAREMAKGLPKTEEKWSVTRLGADRVAGLPCQNVLAVNEVDKSQWELCVSPEFARGDWLRAMQTDNRGAAGWMKALVDAGVEGYPVRFSNKDAKGTLRMTAEVVKFEKQSLPASLFEVPPGYKETSMMGVMAQSPEQAQQMEEAQKQMEKAMQNMTPEQRKMMEEMMKGKQKP